MVFLPRIVVLALLSLASVQGHSSEFEPGLFSAVTESELYIELRLAASKNALLIVGYSPVGDAPCSESQFKGKWRDRGGSLELLFKNEGSLVYKIEACLSYSEFGMEGCSSGLRLVSHQTQLEDFLSHHGLWRNSALDNLFPGQGQGKYRCKVK